MMREVTKEAHRGYILHVLDSRIRAMSCKFHSPYRTVVTESYPSLTI